MTAQPVEMTEAQQLVEWDWLYGKPRYRVLHHGTQPAEAVGQDDWPVEGFGVATACGLTLRWAAIPGIFSRLAVPRCAKCCAKLGYPRGNGSPKNDDACRPLVEARIAAAKAGAL